MRFRYPLQKIVDLKGNQKTQAEWMLSEAVAKLREEELGLNALLQEQQTLQERLRKSAEQPLPIVELQALQTYIDYIGQQIERKLLDVAAAQQHVHYKQQQLLERTLDEKVWLKSREKAYHHFVALESKKEQAELDEIAIVRQGFERKAGGE